MNNEIRSLFDETLKSMMNGGYSKYCFYAYMISMCKLSFTQNESECPTAGVYFNRNMYNLIINTDFFSSLPESHRVGLLKHEMLHILGNHLTCRASKSQHFNVATDCAINQLIETDILPDRAILPDFIRDLVKKYSKKKINVESKKEAEYYLDILDNLNLPNSNQPNSSGNSDSSDDSNGQGSSNSSGNPENTETLDDHRLWDKSIGSEDVKNAITREMIQKASKQAASRGSIPAEIQDFIDLFSGIPKVSWKRELVRATGNKRIGYRSSLLKTSRRFPNRPDLRGRKTLKTYDIGVVLDVSGSMEDKDIITGLTEISEICKITNSKLKIVQADTEPKEVVNFDKHAKNFKRLGCGGTYLEPGVNYVLKNYNPDLVIVITDGYCEDVSEWRVKPKKTIFLVTTDEKLKMFKNAKQFNIKDI